MSAGAAREARQAPSEPNAEQASDPLLLAVPESIIERVAERAAELVAERLAVVPESWIGLDAAAKHLAAPKSRLYALVSARRIPHRKDGSRLLFKRSELDEWIDGGGGRRP